MSDDRFRELAIAHLLRELGASEEASFAAELMRRGEPGHAILREIQEPLGDLALAVEPAEPPASLRARVLSDVAPAATREVPPAPRAPAWPWLLALILALAALGLGTWGASLAGERDRLRAAVARLEARVSAAESDARRSAGLADDSDLIRAPETIVHELAGTTLLPDARARAFVDTAGNRLVLYASGLPGTGAEEVYALWAIGAEGPRAAGAFRSDAQGQARLERRDAGPLGNVQALTVTVEPAPGGATPTGAIVLSWLRP